MPEPDEDKEPAPQRIGVRAFRGSMTSVLRQARQGSTFLVTARDEVLAEIHPPSAAFRPLRQSGRLRGKIQMASDFDELSPDVLAAMEGEEG